MTVFCCQIQNITPRTTCKTK